MCIICTPSIKVIKSNSRRWGRHVREKEREGEREQKYIQGFGGKLEERDNLEDHAEMGE
jgi:hypothetical protein